MFNLKRNKSSPMVFSIRGRPEAAHKTLLGINNATMLSNEI